MLIFIIALQGKKKKKKKGGKKYLLLNDLSGWHG